MKNILLVLTAVLSLAAHGFAALALDEPFEYPDGILTNVSGGQWTMHGGTPDQVDVAAGKVNLTFSESEDVSRLLPGGPYATGTLYASMVVNFSALPGTSGTYFAHFKNASTTFRGRIFATTDGAAEGSFRMGIANGGNSPSPTIEKDLALAQDYLVVLRLELNPVNSVLWINPVSELSLSDRADATDPASATTITAFAFRQASGMGTFTVDNLKVGTAFADVVPGGDPATNAPVIAPIADQSIPADSATPALPFTVVDGETPAADLIVTVTSSHPTLVPNQPANLVLGGADTNRTITVIPAAGQQGTARITIAALDPDNNTALTSFTVVVGAPAISSIPNQFTPAGTPTAAIAFTVGDNETPADSLTLTGTSSHPELVPEVNLTFGGSGAHRTVVVAPTGSAGGFVQITVTVSDGSSSAATSFFLSVNPLTGLEWPSDDFNYEDGPITIQSGFKWSHHSGSNDEMQVTSGKLRLDRAQSEDVNALYFYGPLGYHGTNDGTVIYASFAVQLTELPPADGGDYLAHLKDDGTANYRARIYATTNGAAPGGYRLGIANGSGGLNAVHPNDLALQDIAIVSIRYLVGTAESVLWVNALAETDYHVAATDPALPVDIYAFAFRQSGGLGVLSVDNLLTGGAFADVFQTPPPPNASPIISAITDQETTLDVPVGPLALVVGDVETAADELVLSAASDHPDLVPVANIVFGGSASNRTVTVTPATGEFGAAQITLTVTDAGERTASTSFTLTVLAANTPPSLTALPPQQTAVGTPLGPLAFAIGDLETPAENLTLSATSSDLTLVPVANIMFGGSGSNRTVTLTPVAGLAGVTTIEIAVRDDLHTTTMSFVVSVVLAELLIEPFAYADGSVVTNSGFLWSTHSGATGQTQVASGKLRLTMNDSEDLHAGLANAPYEPASGLHLYASFTVVFRELPRFAGSYFAHFKDDTATGFRARVNADTNGAAPGTFRLGVYTASASGLAQVPTNLNVGTPYRVVLRYHVGTATSALWVDPTAETDTPAIATDTTAPLAIWTFAFRQAGNMGAMEVDDLKVGTTFAAVLPEPAVRLDITRVTGGLGLSWRAGSHVLQSTTGLPGGWDDYSDQGTTLEGRQTITINSPAGFRFFRLIQR